MGSKTKTPKQFFLVPDPKVRTTDILSTNTQGGKFPSVSTPTATNDGSLSMFCTGTQTTDEDYSIRVQDSGKLDETTFVYKKTTEGDELYRGEPDRRFPRAHSCPFGTPNYGYSSTGAYCAKASKEVVACLSQSSASKITIAHRAASEGGTSNGAWTTYDLHLYTPAFGYRGVDGAGSATSLTILQGSISLCDTASGSLLLFVRYNKDIDVYLSDDGENWSLLATEILGRFSEDKGLTVQQIRSASSGSYVRLVFVGSDTSEYFIRSLVSSDNGISWADAGVYSYDGESALYAGKTVTYGADNWSFDVCGIGDESGSFLMTIFDEALACVRTWLSAGTQDWTYAENLDYAALSMQVEAPMMLLASGQDTDWIWLFLDGARFITGRANVGVQNSTEVITGGGTVTVFPTNYEQNILYIPKSANLEAASWTDLGEYYREGILLDPSPAVSGFQLAQQYRLSSGCAYVNRGAVSMICGLMDGYDGSMQSARINQHIYMRYGGWDTNPEYDYNDIKFGQSSFIPPLKLNPTYRRAMLEWVSWIGAPAGVLYARQTNGINWTENRLTATRNWNAERLRLTVNGATLNHIFYEWRDPSSPNVQYNWMYQVDNQTYNSTTAGQDFPVKERGGQASINWMCKVQNGAVLAGATSSYSAVEIQGYVSGSNAVRSSTSDYGMRIIVCVGKEEVAIYDQYDGSVLLGKITPSSGTYGTDPFESHYWEFRLGITGTVNASSSRQVCLICRREGDDEWLSTGNVLAMSKDLGTSASSGKKCQKIKFGMLRGNISGRGSLWKYIYVHPCNDLRTMAYGGAFVQRSKPDIIRGKIISGSPTYLRSGLSSVWGGASGAEGDTFTVSPTYTYPSSNSTKFSSPRQQWRSAGATSTLEMVLNSAATTDKWWHDSGMVLRTNAKTAAFAYSTDNVTYTTSGTIDMSRMVGRVSAVDGAMVSVDFNPFNISASPTNRTPRDGEYSSTKEETFYGRLTNTTTSSLGEDVPYIIDRHWKGTSSSAKFQLQMSALDSGFNSSLVGSTFTVYADRGWTLFPTSPPQGDKSYMKVTLTGSATETEGYLYAGTISAGTSLTLRVPFNWKYTDAENGNNEMYQSKSNLTWGYCNSGASRSFSGMIDGDVSDQLRQRIRTALRKATNYEQEPLLFVLQDDDIANEFMLWGRVTSGSKEDNVGWYWDAVNMTWKPIGSLKVTIDEVI